MNTRIRWEKQLGRHANGETLFCGKIPVASVVYAIVARNETSRYDWRVDLPGKKRAGSHSDMALAKAHCAAAFEEWLTAAGLK